MSAILAVIQAVVTATPSVTPLASPVVVAHASFLSQLNSFASSFSATDLLVGAGVIATALQYLINKFVNFKKFTNQLLGLVLPFIVIAPTLIATGSKNAAYGGIVYAIAQTLYYVIEKIKVSTPVEVAIV